MDVFSQGLTSNIFTGTAGFRSEQQDMQQRGEDSQLTGLQNPFLPTNSDGTLNQNGASSANSNLMLTMRQKYMAKRAVIQDQVAAVDVSRKLLTQYQSKLEEATVHFKAIEAGLVSLQDAELVEGSLRTAAQARMIETAVTVRQDQKKAESVVKIHRKDIRNTQDRINTESADLEVLQREFREYKKFIADMGAPVSQWDSVQIGDIGDGDFDLLPEGNNPRYIPTRVSPTAPSFVDKPNSLSSPTPYCSNVDIEVQYSDGMYIPAFESKAHNQRTLHKMMQELEVRLKWPLTIETERELYALSEFQATLALTANPRLEQFTQKVREVKAVIEANKHYLDRLTIVQLELQLIPKMSRQAIAITLQSLGRQPAYRKELSKPGHFDTRKSLHMTLPGEVKLDPSANWKNPNKKVSMAVARPRSDKKTSTSYRQKYTQQQAQNNKFKRPGKVRPFPNFQKQKTQRPRRLDRPQNNTRRPNNDNGRSNNTENRQPRDPNNATCFNCQRRGHIKRNCPNTAVQAGAATITAAA